MTKEQITSEKSEEQINIIDNIPGIDYSNIVVIEHNEEEFHLRFIILADKSGKVVAKIVMAPGHVKRLIDALQENVNEYEKNFKEIKLTPRAQVVNVQSKKEDDQTGKK